MSEVQTLKSEDHQFNSITLSEKLSPTNAPDEQVNTSLCHQSVNEGKWRVLWIASSDH